MKRVWLLTAVLISSSLGKVELPVVREAACVDHNGCGAGKYCANACRARQGCEPAVETGVSGLFCDDCSNCVEEYSYSGSCAHCKDINICSCTTCINGVNPCMDVSPGVCTRITKSCQPVDAVERTVATAVEYIKVVWKREGANEYNNIEISTFTDNLCNIKNSVTPSGCQVSKDFGCKRTGRLGDLVATCPTTSKYPQFEVTKFTGSCTSTTRHTLVTTADNTCRKVEQYNQLTKAVEPVYMKATCTSTKKAEYVLGRTLAECQQGTPLSISFNEKEKCLSDGSENGYHQLAAGSCFETSTDPNTATVARVCLGTSLTSLGRATGQDADVSKTLSCPSGTLQIQEAVYKRSDCNSNRRCHTTPEPNPSCSSCTLGDQYLTDDVRLSCQGKKACTINVPDLKRLLPPTAMGCTNPEYLEVKYGCSTCGSFVSKQQQQPSFAPVICDNCRYTPYSVQCRNSCNCLSHSAEACQCKSYEYTAPTAEDWASNKLDLNPEYLPTVCRHPETYSCRAPEADGTCKTDYVTCDQCGCTTVASQASTFPIISCMSSSGICAAPTGGTCPSESPTCSKISQPELGSNCGCRRFIYPLTSDMGNSLLCISKAGDCYLPTGSQCSTGLSLCHQCGCGTLEAANATTQGARYCIEGSTCTLSTGTCKTTETLCQTIGLSDESQVAPQQACGCSDSSLTGSVCVHTGADNELTCTEPLKSDSNNLLSCPTAGSYICTATSTKQLERLTFTSDLTSVNDATVFETLVSELAKYSVTVRLDISCPATAFQCTELPCSYARPDMVLRGCVDYRESNGSPQSDRGAGVLQSSSTPVTKIIDFYLSSTSGDVTDNIRSARASIVNNLSKYGAFGYLVLEPGGVIVRTITPAPSLPPITSGGSSSSCGSTCVGIIVFIVVFALLIIVVLYCSYKRKVLCWSEGDESNEKTEEGMMPVAGTLATLGGGNNGHSERFPQRVNPVDRLHEMAAHNTRHAGNTPAVVDVPINGWQIGAACEAEYHGSWHPATITDYDGNLYEVKWTEDDTLSKVLPTELRPRTSIVDAAATAVAAPTSGQEVGDAGVAAPIPSSEVVGVCKPMASVASTSAKSDKKKKKKNNDSKADSESFAGPVASAAVIGSISEHVPSEVEESVIAASPEIAVPAATAPEVAAPVAPPADDDGW
eukprot:TRINITY_DN3108_c0_g3_i1.p1 TRINITY_DN3108_c0_g3~~TRINITY_DN3108_c0_g3_i1.p1  ORF type:complete len:1176 (+),score=249.18 TRINITY_DN3108_c0_g3_i1:38-3529(+)